MPLAAVLNIWQDEAYTLHTTSGDMAYAFSQAVGFEQNAPLYFLIVTALRHVNDSLFFIRLFSVLCIAATLAIVPRVVSRYLPTVAPGWVIWVLALNPFTIYAAIDARVYAFAILVSTLLLLAFYEAFLVPDNTKRIAPLAAWSVLAAIALYSQYYLAFLVAAQAMTLALFARRALVRFCAGAALAFAAFAPLARLIPGQVSNFDTGFAAPSLPESLATTARILIQYVVPLHGIGHTLITTSLAAIALVALVIAIRTQLGASGYALIIVMTVLAAGLLGVALWAEHVVIFVRHLAFLFVPAILSLFALVTFVKQPFRARLVVATSLFCAIVNVFALFSTYRALANPGDWIRVSAYLREHEQPGQPIVVFEAENTLPLQYHYRGSNTIVPIPTAVTFTKYVVSDFVVNNEAQLRDTMPQAKAIWLVRAGECRSATLDFGCAIVDRYLTAHYRVVSLASFYGSSVALLTPFATRR